MLNCKITCTSPSKSLYFGYRQTFDGSIFGLFIPLNPLRVPQSVNVSLIGQQASIIVVFRQIPWCADCEQICRVTRFTRVLLSFTPFITTLLFFSSRLPD